MRSTDTGHPASRLAARAALACLALVGAARGRHRRRRRRCAGDDGVASLRDDGTDDRRRRRRRRQRRSDRRRAPSSRRRRTRRRRSRSSTSASRSTASIPARASWSRAATRRRRRPANGDADGDGPADNQVFVTGEGPGGTSPEIDEEFLAANEACRGHLANATPRLRPHARAGGGDGGRATARSSSAWSEHGIEGGGFTISVGEGPALDVEERPTTEAPPPVEIDPEEFQAAAEECQSVYDDYPELDDVFPDGGPWVACRSAAPRARWLVRRRTTSSIGAVARRWSWPRGAVTAVGSSAATRCRRRLATPA